MSGPVEIARASWGEDMPEWVTRLASECAASSQNRVARRLGVSGSLISSVLRAKYGGSLANIRDLVEGHFMNGSVECPGLGQIRTHVCAAWRRKARDFVASNTLRVRMYRACRACPKFTEEEG